MSPETFDRVLDKIIREDPFVGAVALYNFGEPLLNRELPEIIRLAHDRRVQTTISSNLNFKLDFTEVIKARPTWFRVSVSGYGPGYEITHTGGRWDLFQQNLVKLKDLQAEHDPGLNVEVFYHIYKDRREEYLRLKELCDSLGFTLRVRHAALAPLDIVRDYARGREISPEARRTIELQRLPIGRAIEQAQAQKDQPCPYRRCQWITWDLRVRNCMEWFGPGLELTEKNFLETTVDEIIEARRTSAHCRDCMADGLHRCYLVYGDESLLEPERDLR
jgi:Pyruvate-formate lyase-activating enzyme